MKMNIELFKLKENVYKKDNCMLKCGIAILLEDQKDFEFYYNKLTEEEKKQILKTFQFIILKIMITSKKMRTISSFSYFLSNHLILFTLIFPSSKAFFITLDSFFKFSYLSICFPPYKEAFFF